MGNARGGPGRARRLAAVAGVVLAVLGGTAGCGDDDDDASGDGDAADTTEPTPALEVLVTNDDGYAAEGIDTLVEALRELPEVEVTVVAPAEQQSGTGGRETPGEVTSREDTTRSGYEATAVDGFPSDAVRVALEDMGLEPDVVVSGINEGQNLGPVVDASGTIGAARVAVRAGIPALAVSQGLGEAPDYPTAAELAVEWVEENRAALAAGDLPAEHVVNLNVPTCPEGEVRDTVEVATATSGDALAMPDCTVEGGDVPADDVAAFQVGYATVTEVPPEPAGAPAG